LKVEVKTVDDHGRIVLQKDWREKHLKGNRAIVYSKGDLVEVRPNTNIDLTKYFDKIEVDLKADFSDWSKVRRELNPSADYLLDSSK
jgi:hypothetical protein